MNSLLKCDIIENKKYQLYRFSKEREISIVKKEGLYYFYEDTCLFGSDFVEVWLSELFEDYNVILHKDGYDGYCYVLLKKTNGRGVLIEIKTREIILEADDYEDIKGYSNRTILTKTLPDDLINPDNPLESAFKIAKFREEYSKEDALLVILEKRKSTCCVYSISEGYVFGPYNYKTIEEYKNGVILDCKFAIDKRGHVFDLSLYHKKDNIYYNTEKNLYYYFDDNEMGIIHGMSFYLNDDNSINYNYAYYQKDYEVYIFDTRTKEVKIEYDYSDNDPLNTESGSWSYEDLLDAGDSAFEGYSALELGID